MNHSFSFFITLNDILLQNSKYSFQTVKTRRSEATKRKVKNTQVSRSAEIYGNTYNMDFAWSQLACCLVGKHPYKLKLLLYTASLQSHNFNWIILAHMQFNYKL